MGKVNTWYVLGVKDKESPFGYRQITVKGRWFNTYNAAEKDRVMVQEYWPTSKLVIMKRTCEVL